MTLLAIQLILAHILGDFVFQPESWVKDKMLNKAKSVYFYAHLLVHTLVLLALLQFKIEYLKGIGIIIITHGIVDWLKLILQSRVSERLLFVIDQIIHLLIIGVVVNLYEPYTLDFSTYYTAKNLLLVTSVVFVTFVSSVIMQKVLAPWEKIINKKEQLFNPENTAIDGAGKIIGILERLFVFSFVLFNNWSAIGFLITAKSVFRFGDLSKGKSRQLTEYILIGTLISFGLAISTGIIYNFLIAKLD